jgi:DNA-binding winged helix-turn-helix (wHTH) protein
MSEIYPHSTSAAPPLRNRSEASFAATLCLLFKLAPGEGQVLAKLVTHDHCTKDELRTIAGHNSVKSLTVTIFTLRKKLKLYDIEITTIYRRGYGVDTKSRDQIHKLLAEYEAGIALTRLKPKPDLKPDVQSEA